MGRVPGVHGTGLEHVMILRLGIVNGENCHEGRIEGGEMEMSACW